MEIALVLNENAFQDSGKSRLRFNRVDNKVLWNEHPIEFGAAGPGSMLRKTTSEFATTHQASKNDTNILAILPNSNLGYSA